MMKYVNYFVCTLGQAATVDGGRPFRNVNHLVDEQAKQHPNLPAVGFYRPAKNNADPWDYVVLTFEDVRNGTINAAQTISQSVRSDANRTIALLCSSSPQFLLTWLGLIRLGHSVLLIAPQCSPSAISQLCKSCRVSEILYDGVNKSLAQKATNDADVSKSHQLTALPSPMADDYGVFDIFQDRTKHTLEAPKSLGSNIAYLHHTSGTSSGTPKPIPQSHHAAVGVLPQLDGFDKASFTTTPLYHGGVADVFRAWASNALIWLFPAKELPITAVNIIKCLQVSENAVKVDHVPAVSYFSSVPYILQMMAEDSKGLDLLVGMDVVGVGGAALPTEVGNALVEKGVNLISRFGSAECGFLMSSHREYPEDKEWQYLRADDTVSSLVFEPREDGLAELIIRKGWPHMAKTNRSDDSYATSDLFQPHENIPNAWKYHSRSDAQLTLITGKKFDPSPLEDAMVAATNRVSDALIFGNSQPYPGVLLFRSEAAASLSDDEFIKDIVPIVEKLNSESQSHARVPRNMIIPMLYEKAPLEKSSKGTILRKQAEEKFGEQIDAAYDQLSIQNGDKITDDAIPSGILSIIHQCVGTATSREQLGQETDLFAYGVDSVASVQIRRSLSRLLPEKSGPLPLTVVQDCGTVAQLSELIMRIRNGQETATKKDQRKEIPALVEAYSRFVDRPKTIDSSSIQSQGMTVLLTGPTGSLGSHILSQLLATAHIRRIYLLVRGATQHAARERVLKALTSRSLAIPSSFDEKVIILPCKLSDSNLGLSDTDYTTLTTTLDVICHLAWSVNFLLGLSSFHQHLSGIQNLLNLALRSARSTPPRFLFCSSIASIANYSSTHSHSVPEEIISTEPSCAGPTGYAASKLTAELICAQAALHTHLGGRISIVRVGQLSGDTVNGVWSRSEAYPLILGSAIATRLLPDLGDDETTGWIPVDVAARCFIEAARDDHRNTEAESQSIRVLHLLNPDSTMTFTQMCRILNRRESFEIVPADQWLRRLEKLQNDSVGTVDDAHPALKLLGFWQQTYKDRKPSADSKDGMPPPSEFRFAIGKSIKVMPSLEQWIKPLDEQYIFKLWGWIKDNTT